MLLQPRILIIAGSDSGGGAGIQADLKTVTMLGGYGMTAITALTAQNTQDVYGIHTIPPAFIAQQMQVCIDDIGVDAVKIGMLHDAAVINAVAEVLPAGIPLVLDPVMVAKSGAVLLEPAAINALKQRLLPLATLLTPNIPEAEQLTGLKISTVADMQRAGRALLDMGCQAVLMKGGHLPDAMLTDVLITQDSIESWQDSRLDTLNTHGTGCTLSSAIATGLGDGLPLIDAVDKARAFVRAAMLAAPGYGKGSGRPMGHAQVRL